MGRFGLGSLFGGLEECRGFEGSFGMGGCVVGVCDRRLHSLQIRLAEGCVLLGEGWCRLS